MHEFFLIAVYIAIAIYIGMLVVQDVAIIVTRLRKSKQSNE